MLSIASSSECSVGVFVLPVTSLISNQLVSTGDNKTLAVTYGSIFQKAIRVPSNLRPDHSSDDLFINKAIEESIQNYLHAGVYASDAKYFRGLRHMIKSFHDINRSPWMEDFLMRVFEPIIWRSMKCANAVVRSQATQLFLDVFPLQRSTSSSEESDAIIQKQFDQLTNLLKDADHRVRAIATEGVCHILREYWDALPLSTIHNLLKYIFDTLAVDSSSANVRLAAMSGIHELLQQPLSHSTLKSLLPLLSKSISDKSEKVRLQFINILVQV